MKGRRFIGLASTLLSPHSQLSELNGAQPFPRAIGAFRFAPGFALSPHNRRDTWAALVGRTRRIGRLERGHFAAEDNPSFSRPHQPYTSVCQLSGNDQGAATIAPEPPSPHQKTVLRCNLS